LAGIHWFNWVSKISNEPTAKPSRTIMGLSKGRALVLSPFCVKSPVLPLHIN